MDAEGENMNAVQFIKEEKLIAIVRGVLPEQILPFAEAVWAGGVRILELTYRADAPETDAQNAENIRRLCEAMEGRMLIGAGTVLTLQQVKLTAQAGGKFIISPNTDRTVVEKTRELGLISMPGALTPTEIVAAWQYGAHFVKLFPASDLGTGYVKAIRAPISHIPLLAVGGITPKNIPDFQKAGVCGFGVGSAIVNRQWIANAEYEKITASARQFVRAAKG